MLKTVFGGLLHKEWIVMKRLVFGILLLDILIIILAPLLVTSIVGKSATLYEHTHIIAGMLLALHMFCGVFILFSRLKKEMGHPGMWLHSPAKIVQLAGAKIVFALAAAWVSLLFSGILAGVMLNIIGDPLAETTWSGIPALASVLLAISIKLMFMTAVGWFFWSIYKLVESRLRFISVPVALLLFVAAVAVWEQLRISGLFDWLRSLAPVRLTNESFYNEQTSYFFMGFVPDGIAFSLGNLIFYLIASYVLLWVSSAFFEKKVRL